MIILDPFKLKRYWDGIAQGFQKSPFELILSIVIIVVLLTALITLLVLFLKREKRRRIEKARKAFDRALERKKLTIGQQELLLEMADALPNGRESAVLSLLSDPSLFNSAAKRLQETRRISDSQIADLKKNLGLLRAGSQGILHYTQELEEGSPVVLRGKDQQEYEGIVADVEASTFAVMTSASVEAGQNIEIRVFRPGGLYTVSTRLSRASNGLLILEHSAKVKRVQNRRYFRKLLKLPIYIRPLDPDGVTVKTRLVDLGGGGARFLDNPELRLQKDQYLIIMFQPEKSGRLTIKARVTRITESDGTVSVSFDKLRESTRDRIMRLVLR
jgi:c-di-GMP-binding flagellar brake protein YcgR/type II secretory pathway pseudopilin PulG